MDAGVIFLIKIRCTAVQANRWKSHLSQYHLKDGLNFGRPSLSEPEISEICSLRLKGHTTKEISSLTGFSEKTVCKYLNQKKIYKLYLQD